MNTMTPHRLEIKRVVNASPQRVFDAFTTADIMRQWFFPSTVTLRSLEFEPRVGADYHITFITDEGDMRVFGTVKEVDRPNRLAFSWTWEEDPGIEAPQTLVTIEFKERGERTEVVLTHENLASEESRDNHRRGWESILEKVPV